MKRVLLLLLIAGILTPVSTPRAAPPFEGEDGVEEEAPGRLKILGLSLLLPGLGHRSLGLTNRAYAFMGVDVAIWSVFGVARVQGDLRRDSYVEMAGLFAGVDSPSGRSSDYYRIMGTYRSSDEYNDEVRRDARARTGDDLQAREEYYERHRIRDELAWYWTSLDDWERYQDKRRDSNEAFKRAGTMIGVAVANRLLAAVDALRIVHHRKGDSQFSFYLTADPVDPREPARLCVSVPLR